jgi:hypothetical protein
MVIIDTKALKRLTVNYKQYLIYRKTYNTVIDILKASAINVQFSINFTSFISSVIVNIPVSNVKIYIIKADTPFLLYFADMDTLKVYYNNLKRPSKTDSAPVRGDGYEPGSYPEPTQRRCTACNRT